MSQDSLYETYNKHGYPKALIDNNQHSIGYAIYDYSEQIFGFHNTHNLLENLDTTISNWKNSDNEISALGYISYDIKNIIYPHINFKPISNSAPLYWFAKPNQIISYNINNYDIEDNKIDEIFILQDLLEQKLYGEIISKIKKELEFGNAYQINMTMLKKYKITIHPFFLYLIIRKFAKPKFGYYLQIDDEYVLSFSPEQFFNISNNIIKTFPMKGTRPRGKNKEDDNKLKLDLRNADKDRAEHLMIVDLMRNDIGKICKYGSVNVKDLFKVYSYETVNQMVSCVYGELNNSVVLEDIIKALFPGGSITGAPKESAMQIIDKLENYSRGVYTGGIGYFKNNGDINFNMAIRTMIIENMIGKYSVGGGIVWDSDPIDEWEEAQLKSKILNGAK